MAEPASTDSDSQPGRASNLQRSNSIPFPSASDEQRLKESHSSSSNLTSSDKLTALPTQSTPVLDRLKSTGRSGKRSTDASLTSIDSASGSLRALHALPDAIRQSESDSSVAKDTPRARNESGRSLPGSFQNVRAAALGRLSHNDSPSFYSRDSPAPTRGQVYNQSPPPSRGRGRSTRSPDHNLSPRMQGRDTLQTPPSRSPAQSRAASPLRILHGWNLHRNHTRDERFIPPDPFSSHIRWFGFRREHSPSRPLEATPPYVPGSPAFSPRTSHTSPKPPLWSRVVTAVWPIRTRKGLDEDEDEKPRKKRKRNAWRVYLSDASFFFTYTLPRLVYLNFLLQLPALYWQRVARVFEDAELSKPEIERLIDACGDFAHDPSVDAFIAAGFTTPTHNVKPLPNGLPYPEEWTPPTVSPALARFKISWENFVDTLMREWKTFNLVSALLTTAILTIFQIEDAANDPVTRWASLFSLIFAIMSLSFGCVYIVHFGTMRSMDRASRWAEEARKTRAAVLWNIWVLLATPAVWLAWSMITFCIAILSFVWRTGSEDDVNGYPPLTKGQAVGVRVAISIVFAFGLFNFAMIIRTFSAYSHLSVKRDRQSRFRAEWEEERGRRERRNKRRQSDDEKERGKEKGKRMSPSMVGLGLSGVGEKDASSAGVILENVDLEKGDGVYLAGERLRPLGTMSPRLSPKL